MEGVMGYESLAPLDAVRHCVAISGPKSIAGSGRVSRRRQSGFPSPRHGQYEVRLLWPFAFDLPPRYKKRWTRGPLTLYENPDRSSESLGGVACGQGRR
jgi:hypothetical protein